MYFFLYKEIIALCSYKLSCIPLSQSGLYRCDIQACLRITSLQPLCELGFVESWTFILCNNTNLTSFPAPRLLEHESPFPEPLLLSFYSVSLSRLTSRTAMCLALCILLHLASEPRAGYCQYIDTLGLSPACSVSWGPYIRLTTGHHLGIPPTAQNCSAPEKLPATLCPPSSVFRGQGAVCSYLGLSLSVFPLTSVFRLKLMKEKQRGTTWLCPWQTRAG